MDRRGVGKEGDKTGETGGTSLKLCGTYEGEVSKT